MSSFATFYFIPCIQCSTEITHIKFQLTPVIKRPIFAVPNTPQKTLKIHQFFFPPPIFLKLYRVQVLGTLTQNAKFQSPTLPRSFLAIKTKFRKINVQGPVQRAAMEGLVQYATETANSNYS